MRIPLEALKCVVYVGRIFDYQAEYRGTAFAVVYEEDDAGIKYRFPYLVTAKHVADKLEGRGFLVRANMKDGSVKDLEVNYLPNEQVKWYKHPIDESADVAVTRWTPPDAETMLIPTTMLLTDREVQQHGIGPGDEVYITGLFTYHMGTSRNTPIVRVGNIAMLPQDKIRIKRNSQTEEIEAYLIEARSIGGLSGSPVFVHPTANLLGMFKWGTNQSTSGIVMDAELFLLGLMCAHYDVELEDIGGTPIAGVGHNVNVGVGAVTPAQKILDIIQGAELNEVRLEMKKQLATTRKAKVVVRPD